MLMLVIGKIDVKTLEMYSLSKDFESQLLSYTDLNHARKCLRTYLKTGKNVQRKSNFRFNKLKLLETQEGIWNSSSLNQQSFSNPKNRLRKKTGW